MLATTEILWLWFPPEWVRAALVLALMSVWVVITLFVYLNRYTRRPYFSFWTVAWMFYSVYLAASIGLEETPHTPFLIMVRRACIGISALFMFWGAFDLAGRKRQTRELVFAILLMVVWSYVAAYRVRQEYWITLPVFFLLAAAGVHTGLIYLRRRKETSDARILGVGFLLWGLHLVVLPFTAATPALLAAGYLVSAMLSSLIMVGMVVQQQVSLSEQNYQTLFDSASDAMFLVEYGTWRILEANASARRLSGEFIGQNLQQVFPELCEPATPAAEQLALTVRRELHRPQPDGFPLVYETSANLLLLSRGPVLLLVARDITDRKRAEEALRVSHRQLEKTLTELRETQGQVIQQERLRALGRMARGVAHDFNNVLAKILGFNDLLLHTPEHLGNPDKVKKYLRMVSASAQDAVTIVNRLREFYRARRETDNSELVPLAQVVKQAVTLTQPEWQAQMSSQGAPVEIDLDLPATPAVRGNAGDLREVVINLTLNAIDAMPAGGRLSYRIRQENNQVLLEVSDTGTGMTEEVRRHCLEPFFTTKKKDEPGLGLAIVYGIVQRHGGSIAIRTAVGQGTTVAIRLPVAVDQAGVVACLPAAPAPTPPLRILVMEDEPLILDIEREYLCGAGHTVETAHDGREGLEKFRAGRFDLVMVDRAMPKLNGDQIARAIKQTAPRMPVIMVTGIIDPPQSAADGPAAVDLVVAKPFSADSLRQAVAQAMAQTARN